MDESKTSLIDKINCWFDLLDRYYELRRELCRDEHILDCRNDGIELDRGIHSISTIVKRKIHKGPVELGAYDQIIKYRNYEIREVSLASAAQFLYLIWESPKTGEIYTIGKLTQSDGYEFHYCSDMINALGDGFRLLVCFPEIEKTYYSKTMFSVFSCRLPDRRRKDILQILLKYGIETYDEFELLKCCKAKLPIDNLFFVSPDTS